MTRDGDCPRCTLPLARHYDRLQRYVGCEFAKLPRRPSLYDRLQDAIRRVTARTSNGRTARMSVEAQS